MPGASFGSTSPPRTPSGRKDFARIVNPIAAEPIDPWLAYRFIKPLHNFWKDVEVYQRDLTNFSVSPILRGGRFENGCVNCHSFANNDPATMTLGIRSEIYDSSTLLVRNGAVNKIASKWGYTAIHPSGRMAAYAIMKVHAFFHTAGLEVRDVVDLDSAIVYYDFDKRIVKSTPDLKDAQRLETYPAWTPDGKWLYFCSAAIPWTDRTTVPPKNFDQTRYELRRISYDIETTSGARPRPCCHRRRRARVCCCRGFRRTGDFWYSVCVNTGASRSTSPAAICS